MLKNVLGKLASASQPKEDDSDYMSSVASAMLQESPVGAQRLLWVLVSVVFVFVLWANFAELSEFTRGEGKVVPSQDVQVVQNLEGGILAELNVAEGDVVARGQVLLRIDDTRFSSSLRETSVRLAQLEIKAARLRAEAQGTDFTGTFGDQVLFEREKAVYQSRQNELTGNRHILTQQIAQKEQALSELKAKVEQLKVSVELLQKEMAMTEPLVAEGAISQVEILRLERQVNDAKGELTASQIALPRADASLKEVREKYDNLELTFLREAYEQLNETTNELFQLKETAEALADRVDRTQVISPVVGVVKRLLVKTIGGIIQPGMDIVEIVPSEEILLVEVKIKPSDIAYLHPGQKARIRFTAYDFSIMGGLDGELVTISPDSITNERGESYYLAKVQTDRNFLGPDGSELPIIPGMTVTADILTGKKTLLQYLVKPIFKTKQLALRER